MSAITRRADVILRWHPPGHDDQLWSLGGMLQRACSQTHLIADLPRDADGFELFGLHHRGQHQRCEPLEISNPAAHACVIAKPNEPREVDESVTSSGGVRPASNVRSCEKRTNCGRRCDPEGDKPERDPVLAPENFHREEGCEPSPAAAQPQLTVHGNDGGIHSTQQSAAPPALCAQALPQTPVFAQPRPIADVKKVIPDLPEKLTRSPDTESLPRERHK